MPDFLSKAETAEHKMEYLNARLEPYVEYLKTLEPGEWGSVRLDAGEGRRTIKRRMSEAAILLGLRIKWKRPRGDILLFELAQPGVDARRRKRQESTA